jgi:glycosyltransferase involved in cell wall biosynthesis
MARLLFVTGTPAGVRRGSGTFVGISVLRQALEDAGHRVEQLAPSVSSHALLPRLAFNLAARREAERRGAFDAVVGFDLDGLFVRVPGARRVASIKGVVADERRFERGWTRFAMGIAARLEQVNVRRADVVLTTSAYAATRIAEEYGVERSRIVIVPEPIALARWRASLDAVPRAPRGGGAVILCVAHLYSRKNVESLVRAVALLKSPARLRIVGTGPQAPALEALVRTLGLGARVALLGHVPFESLAAEYRDADVFCLPSLQEGFGIVFLEAMAAGLPIVACRAAAAPEVVPDGECGLLVPPRDVPALASGLDRLASDVSERTRLGEAGRRRVARYDAPLVVGEFLEAIGI